MTSDAQTDISINKYHKEFFWIAIFIIMSVFLLVIYGGVITHNNDVLWYFQEIIRQPVSILGYLIYALPFLPLLYMSVRWARQNRNFTIKDFSCRLGGLIAVFAPYFYVLYKFFIVAATAPGAMFGAILYPISVPLLVPSLYWIGYGIANIIYTKVLHVKTKRQNDKN